MNIAIVDYEGGNLASVACAIRELGYQPTITSKGKDLLNADRIIFPGVGAAGATMAALQKSGLISLFRDDLPASGIPCLGICIGIQILFEHSEEDDVDTLGLIPGQVHRFPATLKVPHIGWNKVSFTSPELAALSVSLPPYFYFVNSYYVVPNDPSIVFGWTQYGPLKFASAIRSGQWTATQFHLEKSGATGLKLLAQLLS